jgi:hypothetical protein
MTKEIGSEFEFPKTCRRSKLEQVTTQDRLGRLTPMAVTKFVGRLLNLKIREIPMEQRYEMVV